MRWPLLEGIGDDEVRELMSIARRRRFARGEVVFHERDPADTLHLVSKGRFAVRISTPLGDTAILTVLGPGDMFGELALLGGEDPRRSATVSALEAGETMSVHRIDFDGLRDRHPETADVLIAILAGQVRRLSGHLVEALYVPAEKRVRRRLLEVASRYGEGPGTVVPLTQDDLADLAGTSRATVNRVLREEEERGTVELGRGRTTIRDPEQIARRGR
ncbi:Crp/Fnr family transcriptional regulator [Paraconexibacter sp.]|uniref:Crp/Fnr family transcriptional regulator n=1 Tax=Paraconexibacter sp. TaxID=2949640 RepID=UPI003564AB80